MSPHSPTQTPISVNVTKGSGRVNSSDPDPTQKPVQRENFQKFHKKTKLVEIVRKLIVDDHSTGTCQSRITDLVDSYSNSI